jgi:hypothetical protein
LFSFSLFDSVTNCCSLQGRDGNGYPKPEYPTGFTR